MKKIILILLSFLLVININGFILADEIEEETDIIWLDEEITNTSINSIKEPILNSKNACVIETSSKQVLYGKEENKKVPMASTTKIMTAIVLIENMNKLSLDTKVEVGKNAGNIGGSRLGLKKGDIITIKDLLYGLMLCSRE